MQPRGTAQSFGVPRVLVARGQHAGRVRSRADADARADVAKVARVLEQHDWGGSLVGEQRGNVHRRALGEGDDVRRCRQRGELRKHLPGDLADQLEHARRKLGCELARQALELARVAAGDLDQLRAEAHGVLERVKAFEHRERAVAACAAVAGDER